MNKCDTVKEIVEGKGPLRAYASYSPIYSHGEHDEDLRGVLVNVIRAIKARFAEQFKLSGYQVYDTGEPKSPQILVLEIEFIKRDRREVPYYTRDLDALLQRLTMDDRRLTFLDTQYNNPFNRLVVVGYDPEAMCNYIRSRMASSSSEVGEVRKREAMLQRKYSRKVRGERSNREAITIKRNGMSW